MNSILDFLLDFHLYQLVIKMSLIKQDILRREDWKDKGFKAHFGSYLVLVYNTLLSIPDNFNSIPLFCLYSLKKLRL